MHYFILKSDFNILECLLILCFRFIKYLALENNEITQIFTHSKILVTGLKKKRQISYKNENRK